VTRASCQGGVARKKREEDPKEKTEAKSDFGRTVPLGRVTSRNNNNGSKGKEIRSRGTSQAPRGVGKARSRRKGG